MSTATLSKSTAVNSVKNPDWLKKIRHFALDMDGTIYKGSTLFPFTNAFLDQLKAFGIGYTFLTNNSSKSIEDYVKHLHKMGVHGSKENLYTSTLATLEYFASLKPAPKKLLVVGTVSMRKEVELFGFKIVEGEGKDEPDAVMVGFDTGLEYKNLCLAGYWIKKGKPFIATHPDRICPTDLPTLLIDCGAVCAALESATGRKPDRVFGKPDPSMISGILKRHGLRPDELAMVGDRLYTDMKMAELAGARGVLVLTGEATRDDVAQYSPAPDLVCRSIEEIGELLKEHHKA